MGANFGIAGLDWQQRVNWDRLRRYRTERARERMKAHGIGAMLCMYDENVRYITGTLTPGLEPAEARASLRHPLRRRPAGPVRAGRPRVPDRAPLAVDSQGERPLVLRLDQGRGRSRLEAAGDEVHRRHRQGDEEERRRRDEARCRLHRHQHDRDLQVKRIEWVDGMTPMMEARAVKNVDEQECLRMVGAIGDAAHWETMKFLRPGITENQVTAHIMKFLYSIPGMEDVEDVIVSSGPNTWPNWRNFSDRIIQPGDIVFMDLAALTWNGYKSCYYRTYCVGKEPSDEQKEVYATALKWLYDSIDAVKAGTTTREIASKWPSAKEAYGYEEEDQAAANLWGHGLGLAQYDPPVISRIWSLDHPIEIKAGMVFALETQHGKLFRWGVRIEEMLIVHEDRIEIISNFPVQQITVVDPMPGYGAHVR